MTAAEDYGADIGRRINEAIETLPQVVQNQQQKGTIHDDLQ